MADLCNRCFSGVNYFHSRTEQADANHFERHCHDDFEILYVRHGRGKYIVEGSEYPLRSHTLLLTRPLEFHYVCPDPESEYDRYVINFDAFSLDDAVSGLEILQKKDPSVSGVYFSSDELDARVRALFDELDDSCKDIWGEQTGNSLFRANLNRLLIYLSVVTPLSRTSADNQLVLQVIEYINEHLSEPLVLEELAKRFFVSKYYLCHLFRKETGASVLAYQNTKRIALAQQLLASGEPATTVALTVGFSNYSSFYRIFCKIVGHPPARSRENKALS